MSKPFRLTFPMQCSSSNNGHKPGLRDNCPACSGQVVGRKCIICLQGARDIKRFPTKCVITADQQHIMKLTGVGARCEECGEEPFGIKVGEPTECTSMDGKHLLMNYPFRCEICGRGVKINQIGVGGLCGKTYTGEHVLPFHKSQVTTQAANRAIRVVDYGTSSDELIKVAKKRDRLWRVRHARS